MTRERKWALGLIVAGVLSLLTGLGLGLITTGVLLLFDAPRRQPERWVGILLGLVVALLLLPLLLFAVLPAEWTDTAPHGNGIGFVVLYGPLYLAFVTLIPLTAQTCIHMKSLRRRFRVLGLLPVTLQIVSLAVLIAIQAPFPVFAIAVVAFCVWIGWAWRFRPDRLIWLRRLRQRQSARARARAERRSARRMPPPRPVPVQPVPTPSPPALPRTRSPKFGIAAWVVLVLLLFPAGLFVAAAWHPSNAMGALGYLAIAGLGILIDVIVSASCAVASLCRREKHPWLAVSCLAFWGIAHVGACGTIVYFVHFHGNVAN